MGNTIPKTKKVKEATVAISRKKRKVISEEDIRRRAFEIYRENNNTPYNELDDWFRAERELRESDY